MVMGACPGQIPISCVPLTLMVTATMVRACRYTTLQIRYTTLQIHKAMKEINENISWIAVLSGIEKNKLCVESRSITICQICDSDELPFDALLIASRLEFSITVARYESRHSGMTGKTRRTRRHSGCTKRGAETIDETTASEVTALVTVAYRVIETRDKLQRPRQRHSDICAK